MSEKKEKESWFIRLCKQGWSAWGKWYAQPENKKKVADGIENGIKQGVELINKKKKKKG